MGARGSPNPDVVFPSHVSFHPSLPNEALGVVLAAGERESNTAMSLPLAWALAVPRREFVALHAKCDE